MLPRSMKGWLDAHSLGRSSFVLFPPSDYFGAVIKAVPDSTQVWLLGLDDAIPFITLFLLPVHCTESDDGQAWE